MAAGIGTVEIKRVRGGLVLQGLGKTPRGQNFIRQTKALKPQKMSDPGFKSALASAVEEMFEQSPLPI